MDRTSLANRLRPMNNFFERERTCEERVLMRKMIFVKKIIDCYFLSNDVLIILIIIQIKR